MEPIVITLPEKCRELAEEVVGCYGYNSAIEPLCNEPLCESELQHLLSDWLEGASDLKMYQKQLNLKNAAFEMLLGAIFVADLIKFKEASQ
ncbi:hypothetical protein NFHkm12_15630 [Latilactobacillus curvatus]|uniref:hypothetical protein n=1 Tax=Latilactobacillus curvatus TaxID=28038 RepID=UPI000DBB9863|nr:hypothetical protein [Latilactobacillus curvatus]MDG2984334.1 hypothetical protein [Latilactobacillus curvatus]WBY48573.1 hypothetical protein PGA57_07945 [Latilactobacillus curvatus]BBE26737.1 hypothetical protein NFHkm12_15630 [Latilactobacillus curvatus]